MKIIQGYNENNLANIIEVTAATYIGDYAVRVCFNDGSKKLVDFKLFLNRSVHTSIKKYLDKALFRQFKISNGNLNWNDYELIFPIHNLHERIIQ